ncbi:MAG: hypothetical protein JWL90_1404 [Chthoniobacteraceae bacterium]|nr:hypothetical protein [Chthoniobacteraceae bacterium]
MDNPLRTIARVTIWAVAALAIMATALFFAIVQPGGSGVLASLRLPDGSEYMVTQRCNWSPEPYTVAFYMRPAGGKWGWCYIDHQANRWSSVAMTYEPNSDVITVTKQGTWQAALDRKRNAFSIGNGKPRRDVQAPQEYSPPNYAFR